jgi:hypothetical protein
MLKCLTIERKREGKTRGSFLSVAAVVVTMPPLLTLFNNLERAQASFFPRLILQVASCKENYRLIVGIPM